jgi:glutathione synthase/RimK-type ligase-like ATP-grasp enzyme
VIYKPLFGSQGDNIVKITKLSDFDKIINESNIFYIQEFLETKPSHDYRVLIAKNKNKEMIYTMMRSKQQLKQRQLLIFHFVALILLNIIIRIM